MARLPFQDLSEGVGWERVVMTGRTPLVEPCPPELREAALQVLYQRRSRFDAPRLIVEVLREASSGLIDLSGLWVAWDRLLGLGSARLRIIGTLMTQSLAGRAAAIWAPEVVPSWRRSSIAAALVRVSLDKPPIAGVSHRTGCS